MSILEAEASVPGTESGCLDCLRVVAGFCRDSWMAVSDWARRGAFGCGDPGGIQTEPLLKNGLQLQTSHGCGHAMTRLLLDEHEFVLRVASEQRPVAV